MKAETCGCCIGIRPQRNSSFNASDLLVQADWFFEMVIMTSFIRPRFSQSLRCFARAVLLLPVGDVDFFEGRSRAKSALHSEQNNPFQLRF